MGDENRGKILLELALHGYDEEVEDDEEKGIFERIKSFFTLMF